MHARIRNEFVLFALAFVIGASALGAQAMRSETPARALPKSEIAIGIAQWQHAAPAGDAAGDWTRWGFTLEARSSVLGQWALSEEANPAVIGDFLDLSLGLFGATGKRSLRQDPVVRVPMQYGLQVGALTRGGTQLIGRAGIAAGLNADYGMRPFIGARVTRGVVGLETNYAAADESTVSSVLLRWYPKGVREGLNLALRFGEESYDDIGLLATPERTQERFIMLLFSAERP